VFITDQTRSASIGFDLNPELVQVDLAHRAELVFDFSDMVQSVYDTDRDVRTRQQAVGPWFDAAISIKDL